MTRRAVTSLVLAALATSPVYAGEPERPERVPAKARMLAERGRAYHDAGDYHNAIVAFKEAYVIAPSPGLLFNLAQAYRLQGNCDDATLMYRRYLATRPRPEARTIAEGHLQTVERCVFKRGLNIPLDESEGVGPGGMASTESLFIDREAEARSAAWKKNVGIGLTAAGALALGAAAYYGWDAHRTASEVEDAYARGARWKELRDLDARGQRSAQRGQLLGIGGGAAVIGGVTLYLLGRRAERLLPAAIVPHARGAEVSWAWRF